MYAVHEIRWIKCDHSGFYGTHDVLVHMISISIQDFTAWTEKASELLFVNATDFHNLNNKKRLSQKECFISSHLY